MTTKEQLNETLNDLVKINNDRIEGCEKAAVIKTASHSGIQTVFLTMADTSRNYIKEFNIDLNKSFDILKGYRHQRIA